MFVPLLTLTAFPICLHCAISTQFFYLVSNITILPNERVFFTEELVGESIPPSNRCLPSCVEIPKCFIACHTVDGFCIFGHHKKQSENTLLTANSNQIVGYDCYMKTQYFDLIPEDNALLVDNESAALYKSSSSSSVRVDAVTGRAVDGIKHTKYYDVPNTCFHSVDTGQDAQPYMLVDMAATYLVIAFNITNRFEDELFRRLHDFEIRVGFASYNKTTNAVFQQNSLCLSYNDVVETSVFFRNCYHPVAGRYVSLQIVRFCLYSTNNKCIPEEGDKNVLCICELDIFALVIGR